MNVHLVDSIEEAHRKINEYENKTFSKFYVRTVRSKDFGNAELFCKKGNSCILWFDSLPYIYMNHLLFDCKYGPDRHILFKANLAQKNENKSNSDHSQATKTKKLVQCSRKLGCPAKISLKEVFTFPDFKIFTNNRYNKIKASKQLRALLQEKDVRGIKKFILTLPANESEHEMHPVGEGSEIHQFMDDKIKSKIKELVADAVTNTAEIKRYLHQYVTKELFPEAPELFSKSNRRFFPSSEDIRNVVKRTLKKLSYSSNEQENIQHMVDEHSKKSPESLKRKLMMTEAELQTSNAKLKEKESLISVMEPNNKKICVNLENKLEECKKQNQIDSQKIEELRNKLKWVQGEATHAKAKIHEIERQKKIDMDKLEMKLLSMQQEYNNLKTELADVKSEKAETVRKLNIENGRQKNELAEKAAMASALEKELKEATERIKVLENKIEADKDAALIVQSRQAELKKLAELQKENRLLKEEVNKNRENNIALYQEKLWSYQEKLKQAEKKSIAYAKLQVENEQLKGKLAQWDELFDDKSSPFKSPTALSMRLAQYQKNEIALTNKISQLSNHCETLTKQKNELEESNKALNRQLQQYQLSSPNRESLLKRLQRKAILLTKERDHARKLLDSYLSEATLAGVGLNAEFISQLEDMNMEYKKALEKTEKEVDNLNEKIKMLNENNKTEKLMAEMKKLQEENSLHLARIAELEKAKYLLESKCEEKNKEAVSGDWSGRILHLRFNPLDNANRRHLEIFKELQEENDCLKKRVKVLEEECAAATDVTIKVQQKLAEEGSDSTIKSLQEQLAASEKQQRYILDSARAKSIEFREAVYRLTGYRVDVPTSEQYKLSHVYAESRDDYLLFQINSDGIQLIETEYSKQLLDKMELYLHQHDSFPAFLASLTMDLFSQQTYMVS